MTTTTCTGPDAPESTPSLPDLCRLAAELLDRFVAVWATIRGCLLAGHGAPEALREGGDLRKRIAVALEAVSDKLAPLGRPHDLSRWGFRAELVRAGALNPEEAAAWATELLRLAAEHEGERSTALGEEAGHG